MANNLSDKQKAIKQYMKNTLEGTIDSYDLRDTGAFTEMFLSPQIDVMEPLLDFLDGIRLAQSLDNARFISDEMLNEIGRIYNQYRIYGKQAHGYVTFIFDDIPDSGYISIPKGLRLTTRGNLKFSVENSSMYDEISIAKYYDASTYLYKIPVKVVSEGVGSIYNVGISEVSNLEGKSLSGLIGVTNETAFVGGVDTETNEDFAERIKRSFGSANLGISRGYYTMLHGFDEVMESKVVGYRHPLMKRDIIGNVEIPGVTMHEGLSGKHWGSKVDVYIRGNRPVEIEESYEIKKDEQGRLYVKMRTNPVVGIRAISMSAENAGFDPEETDIERLVIERYTVHRDEDFETFGTTQEDCTIYFERVQGYGNFEVGVGSVIDINYIYNSLPQDIHDHMYGEDDDSEENRPPTADVKVKLAHKKFVTVALVVGMVNNAMIQTGDKLAVKTHVELGIDEVKIGGELQISDLVERIYNQNGLAELTGIDYVELPFHFLTFEHHNNLVFHCLSEEKQKHFDEAVLPEEYKETLNYFKETMTVPQFLRALYILSRKAPVTESEDIDLLSRYERYRNLQHAYEAMGIPKVLSPERVRGTEIEYFTLANIEVTEDKVLNSHDWNDLDYELMSLAQKEDASVHIEPMLLFVSLISMVANEAENIGERLYNGIKVLNEFKE